MQHLAFTRSGCGGDGNTDDRARRDLQVGFSPRFDFKAEEGEGDHDGKDDDDDEGALLRFIFLPLSYLAPRLRIGYFGGSQAAHPHDYPGTTET